MATEPLRPGDPDRVGRYRLLGRLGAGGMGQVFLGRSAGGRPVAVKLVHAEYGADRAFRDRFAREVEAARRVGGFFTAQVVDADPLADRPWLVSAYVPGPSLQTSVAEHGPLPPAALRVLAAGLAEGLAAIHACGLVHRDLKPSNVIMASDGPRIIDFGIVRALEATTLTVSGFVAGTPAFMSPEQARGGTDITPASDVFALGSVLAFAATGAAPFGTGQPAAVLYRIVEQDPDLSSLSHVDTELCRLVTACLAKDPSARPTMNTLVDDFAAFTDVGRDGGEDGSGFVGEWEGRTLMESTQPAEPTETVDTTVDTRESPTATEPETDRTGAAGGSPPAPQRRRGLAWLIPTRRRKPPAPSVPSTRPQSVEQGWNGLPWGATTADFQARFPDAAQQNGEWWVTGRGPEPFCGLTMDTQYGFNSRGRLYLVVFYPEVEDRERLPVAALETFGAPDNKSTRWTRGKVIVDVKIAGVAASLTHRGYDDD
ncbi:serine/threonine-protein kinase [Streptomyces odontomachi]|uniref:serine/threonine-protein kinase n=1 Tax=Streptomyces odontomachi TaxID=2944940 RepID=UPI0027E34F0F|nr:serine/threonine-protein kinase [Streptomyces sp. ODS25]